MSSPLLRLPSELLDSVLRFVPTDDDTGAGIRDLLNASKTCTALHHAVFCTTNDQLLWHPIAVSLGVPPAVALDDLLYAGTSALQKRQWIDVVRLNYCWAQPFPSPPDRPATLPALRLAGEAVPRSWWRASPARKKTVELCVAEEGCADSPTFITAHAAAKNNGVAQLGARYCNRNADFDHGLLDPELETPVHVYPKLREDETRFSSYLGFLESYRPEDGTTRISEMAPERKRRALRTWNVGKRRFSTFKTVGDILVGLCRVPISLEETELSARSLVCLRATDGDECDVVWEYTHVHRDWMDTEDEYVRHPRIRNFNLTSTHVVCLVTRSPSHSHAKLTRVEFRVLDVLTGKTCRTMIFQSQPVSSLQNVMRRAASTTVLEHDFILTDKFIVSGGQGGELLVWDYLTATEPASTSTESDTSANGLLYAIPVWCSGIGGGGDNAGFFRTWSALTISVDGRYLGAMVSDQLFVIDMMRKTVVGRYHNGRLIRPRDRYVKNPRDDFSGGIWCWWKEWEFRTDAETGEQAWKPVPNGDGVSYLAGIPRTHRGRWIGPVGVPKYVTALVAFWAFWVDSWSYLWLLAMLSPFVLPLLVAWLLPVEWALRLRLC